MKKKAEPIKGIGRDKDNLLVQKSRPLFALWRSALTLSEFKILDVYLGRINSHDDEHRTVIFEKGEIEKALGVKKINQDDLKNRLKHLMSNVVEVPDTSVKRGFQLVTLFEEVGAYQDDETGLWTIELECTKKAKKYFFNIDDIGYYRYKLRCITAMKSRYTYVMFNYLEANRYRGSWEEPLDKLKIMMSCDQEETYKQYKRFNDLILKKVYKDLNENTECHYDYEPIKKGRKVVAVRFTVKTLPKTIEPAADPDQAVIDQYIDMGKDLWYDAIKDTIPLTDAQYDELRSLLFTVPDDALPKVIGGRDFMLYHYIDLKIKEIKRRDEEKPIRNKYSYLIKMIKQDMKEEDE